jgi:hypothetical protein
VISDGAGTVVRTLEVGKDAAAGLNRVWWDLRMDPTDEVKLRTPPLYVPDFAMNKEGLRTLSTIGPLSVLVQPGTYTVKLVAAGVERSEPLTVLKDPNTAGSEDDLKSQTKTMVTIREAMTGAARTINAAESVRAQLQTWRSLVGAGAPKEVLSAADDLEKQIVAVESRLFNMTATGRGQDFLRTPSQLMEKLSHLADVVSYADFAPTDSQIEVRDLLAQQLSHDREQMDGIFARTLATFNAALKEHQLGTIVAVPSK